MKTAAPKRKSSCVLTREEYVQRCKSKALDKNGNPVTLHLGEVVDFSGDKRQDTFEYTCSVHGRRSNRLLGYLDMAVGCSACSWELRNDALRNKPNLNLRHSMQAVVDKAARLNPKLDFSEVDTSVTWLGYANHPPVMVRCKKHPELPPFPHTIQCNKRDSVGCPLCRVHACRDPASIKAAARVLAFAAANNHEVVEGYKGASRPLTIRCKKHNNVFHPQSANNYYNGWSGCGQCSVEKWRQDLTLTKEESVWVSGTLRSRPEKTLAVHLATTLKTPITVGRRYKFLGGKELDIALRDYMVAVEVNGVYHHDSVRHDKYAHRDKARACHQHRVTLLQFTCQEVEHKLDLVTSMVAAKCGVFTTKLHARKCNVVAVSAKTARTFLEHNHIRGFSAGRSYVGLQFEGNLVAVAVFGLPRFDRKAGWELVRFATQQNVHVSGGLSRLVAAFQREHGGTLVSYADLRYSNAKSYRAAGWKFSHVTSPGYVWVREDHELSRYQTQKHKLDDLLDDFDPDASEAENMRNNGYFQLYDCGHAVFYLKELAACC